MYALTKEAWGGRKFKISFASGHSWSICRVLFVPKYTFVCNCPDFNLVLYRHLMLDFIMVQRLRWHFVMLEALQYSQHKNHSP